MNSTCVLTAFLKNAISLGEKSVASFEASSSVVLTLGGRNR